MKMVKTLLLGSAAGLMAVVGGYVRYQANWANGGNSISNGPSDAGGGRNDRLDSSDWGHRTRAVASFDTRQQTQYGTLRTYLLMGFQQDNVGLTPSTSPNVYMTRGFIQIAGFTFGKATSFYDFFPRAALAYNAGPIYMADTGDGGQMVAAYTAQLGNGVSASIGAEQALRRGTINVSSSLSGFNPGGTVASDNLGAGSAAASTISGSSTWSNGTGIPAIVGNIRVDGAWGAIQLAGVVQDASAGYYGGASTTLATWNGHPSNVWGWGVSPAIRINTPFIAAGDYFVASMSYTQGAAAWASSTNSGQKLIWNGQNAAFGTITDGVFRGTSSTDANRTDVQLTTAWSAAAAYEHFWTPALHTSLYGSYINVSYNGTARSIICDTTAGASNGFAQGTGMVATGCDPSFSSWNLGSRTQWDVTKGLYLGVDVIYTRLKSAQTGGANTFTTTQASTLNGISPATYTVGDQSAWMAAFRIHRDIVPL